MATTNTNRLSYGILAADGLVKLILKVTHASFPVNQGDMVYFDNAANIVKALDTDANAANLAGVALDPSAVSSNIDNGLAPAVKAIAVGCGGVFFMKTTAAETYTDGDPMYVGADAGTVTSVAATNSVGKVLLPSNVSSITGATGVTVPVLIYGRNPFRVGI